MEGIISFACEFFGTDEKSLIEKNDYKNTTPRHMIWHFMHVDRGVSNNKIAKRFGKDRRSVIYGISNMKYRIKMQRECKEIYESFIGKYKAETD